MKWTLFLTALLWTASHSTAEDRPSLVLDGQAAMLVVDLGGGSIADFHLKSNPLNPLQWDSWSFGDTPDQAPPLEPRSMGHFLCLDRWGAATKAEQAHGMGWHGEATRVWWNLDEDARAQDGYLVAQMSAELPLAGLKVARSIRMDQDQAVFAVAEAVTNTRHLGRVYNIVQHPTIGPPFLDESTRVDANGTRGFMQETPMPTPEDPEVRWPAALKKDGTEVDIRGLTDDAAPAVVSYIIDEEYGWTTAINASAGLLIGYIWPVEEYPGSTPGGTSATASPLRVAWSLAPRAYTNLVRCCWKRAESSAARSFTISMPTRPKFLPTPTFSWRFPPTSPASPMSDTPKASSWCARTAVRAES